MRSKGVGIIMPIITIDGERIECGKGELLGEVLERCGKGVYQPCGGHGTCGKCKVTVDGKDEISCIYRVEKDISVVRIPESEILAASAKGSGESSASPNVCLVLDIGTTTLVLALVDLDKKCVINTVTANNPQILFGMDVISRIKVCSERSPFPLQKLLNFRINTMISSLIPEPSLKPNMYVSANTVMLHLFLGVDCSSMGVAPYTAAFLDAQEIEGGKLRLKNVNKVFTLPCFSSFVGADVAVALNCVKLPDSGKYSLLVDLGTNAEILLFTANNVFCTSAAAGPCFEGVSISCGMGASDGAIYEFELINGETPSYRTIGNTQAIGICGTGLIDIVSELLSAELIDENGQMHDDCFTICDKVYISPNDIREFQLAKSAVCAAILTLLKKHDVKFNDIETLYLCGGFSNGINVKNAANLGLFPRELAKKCVSLGNTSIKGAVNYACGEPLISDKMKSEYEELSNDAVFSELFIKNMSFGS